MQTHTLELGEEVHHRCVVAVSVDQTAPYESLPRDRHWWRRPCASDERGLLESPTSETSNTRVGSAPTGTFICDHGNIAICY